jgi:hypothetical protein
VIIAYLFSDEEVVNEDIKKDVRVAIMQDAEALIVFATTLTWERYTNDVYRVKESQVDRYQVASLQEAVTLIPTLAIFSEEKLQKLTQLTKQAA